MSETTGIEWTDHTWNPVKGCRPVSAGCANCYMFSDMRRYGQDPTVITRTKTWGQPKRWDRAAEAAWESQRKTVGLPAHNFRRRVFTCSWSDFFIEEFDTDRAEALDLMMDCRFLDWQILTKRSERLETCWSRFIHRAPRNVWLGVSVENRKQGLPRIDHLRAAPAAIRFLSIEPLLEDLGPIDLTGIDWVICGGESGPGARPMHPEWARCIRDQCIAQNVPFFFKQHGEFGSDHRKFPDFPTWVNKASAWVNHEDVCVDMAGRICRNGGDMMRARDEGEFPVAVMAKVGKKRAGRVLDGRTWGEFPKVAP